MTKFMNAVEAQVIGSYRDKALPSNFDIQGSLSQVETGKRYKLTIAAEYEATCANVVDLLDAKKHALLWFKHSIYGELLDILYDLEIAVYKADISECKKLLTEMRKEILG
ncbi:MAG: hypothetical protein M0R68_15035 [Bacteroidetes bacterium]|nr:hypothetical protein [Bacteroidota bacterium]